MCKIKLVLSFSQWTCWQRQIADSHPFFLSTRSSLPNTRLWTQTEIPCLVLRLSSLFCTVQHVAVVTLTVMSWKPAGQSCTFENITLFCRLMSLLKPRFIINSSVYLFSWIYFIFILLYLCVFVFSVVHFSVAPRVWEKCSFDSLYEPDILPLRFPPHVWDRVYLF